MIRPPVVDTALEGFRLTRERPLTVLLWGAVLLAGQVAGLAILLGSGAAAVLGEARVADLRDPAAAQRWVTAITPVAPALMAAGLIGLVTNVVVYTAVLRAVLTPARKAAGYLRLGLEELRQLGLALSLLALMWLLLTTAAVMARLLTTPLIAAAVLALAFAVTLFLVVRLSLAPAMTQADSRFALRRAWPLTEGLFWPLFGAYALAVVLTLVVSVLANVLIASGWALLMGGGIGGAATVLQPDLTSLAKVLSPASLTGIVLNGLLNGFLLTIVAGPAPAAFKALTGRPA